MSESAIEWTEQTWNPIVGCKKVSPGCKNCYAERMAVRQAGIEKASLKTPHHRQARYGPVIYKGKWNGGVCFAGDKTLRIPLRRKTATTFFVCSMGDLFHESVPFERIDKVFAVMALCPQHTFQVLTKRPERMAEYCCHQRPQIYFAARKMMINESQKQLFDGFPLPNVWLGTTLEHPDYKNRLDDLRKCPASIRFISCEPLLADPGELNLAGIGWVICGGESGPGARPMHPDWARSVRDQCKAAGAPFFFKQWGAWLPGEVAENATYNSCGDGKTIAFPANAVCHKNTMSFDSDDKFSGKVRAWRVGKKKAGSLLDGVEHKEMPK